MVLVLGGILASAINVFASEADLAIPDLAKGAPYHMLGGISPYDLLQYGALVIIGTLGISCSARSAQATRMTSCRWQRFWTPSGWRSSM